MRRSSRLAGIAVTALAATLLAPTNAGAVTVAWDTLIPYTNAGYPSGATAAGGATFLLLGFGATCRVARLDADGSVVWIRDVGSAQDSLNCEGIAASGDRLYVAMDAIGPLDGMPASPGWDAYIRALDLNGDEIWTRSWGRADSEISWSVAAADNGVYLAGLVLDSDTHEEDAFVRRYDVDGNVGWTRYHRTTGDDVFLAAAADHAGVYVAWHDFDGGEGTIRRYDADGSFAWTTRVLGAQTEILGLVRSPEGLFATGDTTTVLGPRAVGGDDAWVASIDPASGEIGWLHQFGSTDADFSNAIAVGPAGVVVAGTTYGSFPRFQNRGGTDAFVRAYSFAGERRWSRQFGTHRGDHASAVLADAGGVLVIGVTDGNLGDAHVDGLATFVRRWVPA